MRNPQQRRNIRVPARLRQHAIARVDQDDRQVGRGSSGCMLRVYCSWPGVSAMMNLRRAVEKIAVGDVDGDSLFPLRAQAIGNQGKIEAAGSLVARRLADRSHLVFVDAFGIVKQPPDQGRFAVVYAAGCGEAEKLRDKSRGHRLPLLSDPQPCFI